MANKVNINPWEEVKQKLNILEVIQDYIPVVQRGGNYKAVCPFHNDKNPSLLISPEKGLWHCFGCGAGGDMFGFVMDYEGINKKEALERLAQKAQIDLPNFEDKRKTLLDKNILKTENQTQTNQEKDFIDDFNLGFKYLLWAENLYHKLLLKILGHRDNPISQYCLLRGLDLEILKTFKIGYSPKNNLLVEQATKNGLDLNYLKELGLLIQKTSNGDWQDKFKDRLMLPIWDKSGRCNGFTGRILPYDSNPERPKYLNSPQTKWFDKSSLWYGWSLNQKAIRREKKAIIVEGNMDVIACYKAGVLNCLASQGTSFTKKQLQDLKFLTKNLILAFDNDEAGKSSGRKLFLEATNLGFTVFKLLIPEKFKDLDEWLKDLQNQNLNLEEIQNILKSKLYLDYYLELNTWNFQNSDLETQKSAIIDFLSLLIFSDKLTQEHYLSKISTLTGKSISALNQQFQEILNFNQLSNKVYSNLKSSEEAKIPAKQDQFQLESFQQLLAFALGEVKFEIPKLIKSRKELSQLFELLKVLLPKLKDFPNLQVFLEEKQEILHLILNESSLDEVRSQNLQASLNRFLDSRFSSFALDDNLKQLYLDYKLNINSN